ncbi:DUF2493 domain-containing protein [bacterium]|jgi:hypothetical protein|nr:DUF2493 domain-containing protein [bacterium]
MKVIIAGSRTIEDYALVAQSMQRCGFEVTEVVCGMATGIDTLGYRWAQCYNKPIKQMPANWNRDGKAAGPIRNREMAKYADAAVIIWDGNSAGTRNMIDEMIRAKKPYYLQLTESNLEDLF